MVLFPTGTRRAVALVVVTLLAAAGCASSESDTVEEPRCPGAPTASVARQWNEALLGAVRLDVPSPTVHARNLFHTSAAMWDAWAAYDEEASGVFVTEKHEADDVTAAREEAISHAAYGVLESRYLLSPGAEESITGFEDLMRTLCLDPADTSAEGDSPVAVGNRIADTVLAASADDGSNEADGYLDPTYQPVNEPLMVDRPGTQMVDPNRWQPLDIEGMVAQNGAPLDENVQVFVGSHWGGVTPFAIAPADGSGPALDPGPPPLLGDPDTDGEFKAGALAVLRHGATLDPDSATTVDIGPGAMGDAPPGQYDSDGWDENPVTGEPYEPNGVSAGDFGRAVAEFWADGPSSETPPGHWNVVANAVTDQLDELRIGGQGEVVDALEWDVKLYLALNGAVHDSAVAAWGAKRTYDYARPISMIRYMGGLGQSSNPGGRSYHPDGLPLEQGLVAVITPGSSAPGARHAHLADHVGSLAVRTWLGPPADPETDAGGVGWLLAEEWMPYQLPTFVTPAFAGYISGHSTFSRAAAEVLGAITGSPYFPGGLGEWTVPAGSLEFEAGPDTDVVLQWASYVDAADQAGWSRLYGGIHPPADDFPGREVGAQAGQAAWDLARAHYIGATD
ncbi:MAG: vanadium-dependent haloperoxidase [Acidimicrobiales bacterium]